MDAIEKQIANLEKNNHWQQIIDLLKPLLKSGNESVFILRSLGFAYSQLDRYDEARYCYKRWIELEPGRAQPYYHVGFTFYDAGQWNEAVEWFDLALERFPDYLVCLYRKGVALFMTFKVRQAKDTLKKAIMVYQQSNNPDFKQRMSKYYYRSIFYLGKCYLQINSLNNARACFEKILQEDQRAYIDPLYVKYNLALSLMKLKKYEQAEQLAITLTKMNSRAEWLYDFWGRLLIEQNRPAEAIQKLNMGLKIRVQPYILADRAKAYYLNGQRELAKNDLHDALRRDRKAKHKILLELAKIAFEEKHINDAEVYARRAIEFKQRIYEADYAEAHLMLHQIYQAMGHTKQAEEELEIAQNICPQLEWEDDLLIKSRIIL